MSAEKHLPEKKAQSARTRLLVSLAAGVLRVWFSTCRVKIIGRHIHDRYILGDESIIGASWHRNSIFMVWFYGSIRPLALFSRSKDGELIASFAEKMGFTAVRGSSSRGGLKALRTMTGCMKKSGTCKAATVVDGPRGPRFVAKTGMIALARFTGAPLLPVMISARPALTLKKTWDQTMIPLPFSRVTIMYRDPVSVPADSSFQELENIRLRLEGILNEMMYKADLDTGYRK